MTEENAKCSRAPTGLDLDWTGVPRNGNGESVLRSRSRSREMVRRALVLVLVLVELAVLLVEIPLLFEFS